MYWVEHDFPLWVFIDKDMSELHVQTTLSACDAWNNTVGVRVFEPLLWDYALPLPRDVGVVGVSIRELGRRDGEILNGLHRGLYHEGTQHRRASMIWFDDDLEDEFLEVVMIHELGHALTLDHDENPRSVMHPHVAQMPMPVFIMPEDAERIRRMAEGEPPLATTPLPQGRRVLYLPGGIRL